MQATVYRQIYSTIMTMRVPASHHHLIVYLIYTLYRLDHLVSTPASASQPGYRLLSSTLSFPPSLPIPCPPNLPNLPFTSAPPKSTAHSSQLRLLLDRPNLKPLTILLQHALIMVFPELLRGVLAHDPLQNLRPTWMFVYKPYPASTLARAWLKQGGLPP